MTTLPASGFISDAARTIADQKQALEDLRDVLAETIGSGGAPEQALTIAGGNITPAAKASRIFSVDTEGAAGTDDLDHIVQTNVPNGGLVLLRPNNAGRILVVRHAQGGGGQLLLSDGANLSMNSTKMWLLLQRRGTDWNEVLRFYGDQTAAARAFLGAAALAGDIFTGTVTLNKSGAINDYAAVLKGDNNGSFGPRIRSYHNSNSPQASDEIFKLFIDGKSSAAGDVGYGELIAHLLDATAGSEDLRYYVNGMAGGVLTALLTIGAGIAVGSASVPGTVGHLNAEQLLQNNKMVAPSEITVISGTAHSPAAADNGTEFIYTNAGGCTVTLPAASGLPTNWRIGGINASGGTITYNRSASDAIWSKNTSLTSLKLPTAGDGGWLHLSAAAARFYWRGRRSFISADFAATINTQTVNAHNLGVPPDEAITLLVNVTGNLNYVTGEVVDPRGFASAAAASGYVNLHDNTNVTTLMGAAAIAIANKTTFATATITTANWNYRTIAHVVN